MTGSAGDMDCGWDAAFWVVYQWLLPAPFSHSVRKRAVPASLVSFWPVGRERFIYRRVPSGR